MKSTSYFFFAELIILLQNVAGETFEGIQKETRAGLEYALETHKTVDLRLDMHAPIIIIPERLMLSQYVYAVC